MAMCNISISATSWLTVITSDTDYALYSMLSKVSNMSLSIPLRDIYSHTEINNNNIPQILKYVKAKVYVKT